MKTDDTDTTEPVGRRDAASGVPMPLPDLPAGLHLSHPMVLGACTMSQILKPFESQLKAGDLASDLAAALDHADLDGFADDEAMLVVQSRNLDVLFNRMLIGAFNAGSEKFMPFMQVALQAQKQCRRTVKTIQDHRKLKNTEQTEGLQK